MALEQAPTLVPNMQYIVPPGRWFIFSPRARLCLMLVADTKLFEFDRERRCTFNFSTLLGLVKRSGVLV